jgi:hypothetical protein
MNPTYEPLAIDNIVNLIIFLQQKESKDPYTIDHKGAKYLLNQTIRQLWLPISRMSLSIEADKLFKKLGYKDEEIFLHFSRMKITNKSDQTQTVNLYNGASSKPHEEREVKTGESFLLREVFHDDHIIPITHIIDRLLTINQPSRESVFEILKDISICRLLKDEDRRLPRTKRPYDEKLIIEKFYYDKGIRIKNYQYLK